MPRRALLLVLLAFALASFAMPASEKNLKNFIRRDGDRLMDGDREFRFISFNIPNLHYVEDQLAFDAPSAWRLPDQFEIDDALLSIKQLGGQVARIYTLSVRRPSDPPDLPRHVTAAGVFNEDAFRALDLVLARANAHGVRLIIPFVDNWKWWGGRGEYAGFRGREPKDFWTDPEVISDFKKTVEYVITRKNTVTGTLYRDDKAILAWETGNELECPHAWTREVAGYIKSLDSSHLVLDGRHGERLTDELIDEPLTDLVTTHHYPDNPQQSINYIVQNRTRAKGKKPYFVGEFGFVSTDAFRVFFDTIIKEGLTGALVWSLRGRSRDGGFYWHSEPLGGDIYKAYHWPGFPSGQGYDEITLLTLMQTKAHEIQGILHKLDPPVPPELLPVAHPSDLMWKGSAGAASYRVERADSAKGPWTEVATNINDAQVPYRPLFADLSVSLRAKYFYRVLAENGAGRSKPSNAVGPVEVTELALVDEMSNYSQSFHHRGKMSLVSQEARKAKEDTSRLRGEKDAFVTYRVDLPLKRCRIYTFFPGEVSDFTLLASADGLTFSPVTAERTALSAGDPDYGYWTPVKFEASAFPTEAKFVRIVFPSLADLTRVEIRYGP